MCGIAGIIDFRRNLAAASLERLANLMGDTIAHRGPDDQGVWTSASGHVCFSHRRLSIIDLSSAGKQPLLSTDQRYVITFNGEIYNHQELRRELQLLGTEFRTHTDTEVLLEAYRKWGKDCVLNFDGMFAFVIYDNLSGEIFAARDPFGEKPFYYAWIRGAFVFASELHALSHIPGFSGETNIERVSEYLALQYLDGENSFFTGASKLLPGTALSLDAGGRSSFWTYFSFNPGQESEPRDTEELVDELEDILLRSLQRRLIADVPVGAFLSGGIDSALVVALITRKLGHPIQTFTTGFSGVEASEHLAARELSQFMGTQHHEQILTPEEVMRFGEVGPLLDEPNGDTSILPTYLLSRFARQTIKVAISGDGGDELFGGYSRYWCTLMDTQTGAGRATPGERYYSSRILVCPENLLNDIIGKVPHGTADLLVSLRGEIDGGPGDLVSRLRATDVRHYLPGAVLAKVDRMSMRNGLEVRTPFLNVELARFVEHIDTAELVNTSEGKLLLKRLAGRYLPEQWVRRKKMGFGIPQHKWAGQQLRQSMLKTLDQLEFSSAWWLRKNGMKQLLEKSLQKGEEFSYQIWSTLVLVEYLKHHTHRAVDGEGLFAALGKIHQLGRQGAPLSVYSFTSLAPLRAALPAGSTAVSPYETPKPGDRSLLRRDWLKQPPEHTDLPAADSQGPVVVLGCNDNAHSLPATMTKHSRLAAYDGTAWSDERTSPAEESAGALFFDDGKRRIVNTPRWNELSHALADAPLLGRLLRWRRLSQKQDYLVDSVELWRADTPQRALQLVRESLGLVTWLFREQAILTSIRRWIELDNGGKGKAGRRQGDARQHIAFIVSTLSAGGAERQLRNLAVALDKKGYRVSLITLAGVKGRAGHYLPMFAGSGVEVINAATPCPGSYPFSHIEGEKLQLLTHFSELSPVIRERIWAIYTHLHALRPDITHCFLDHPNLFGGFASLIAGVPRIILSFRNSNPSHFYFYQRWYHRYYRLLIASRRVILSGNSLSGNRDYAKWLGRPAQEVRLTRNGLDFSMLQRLDHEQADEVRQRLGITRETPVIAGIFRFYPEKRPLFFLQVVAEIKRRMGELKVIMIGEGALIMQLTRQIRVLGLEGTVILAGRQANVAEILFISDLLLHTSYLEGTPNVVLEAQYLSVPVVATAGGGTVEAVLDDETGFIRANDDKEGLVEASVQLLSDRALHQRLAAAGPGFVEREFGLEKMVETMETLYQ